MKYESLRLPYTLSITASHSISNASKAGHEILSKPIFFLNGLGDPKHHGPKRITGLPKSKNRAFLKYVKLDIKLSVYPFSEEQVE